jgi:hypothetical protein
VYVQNARCTVPVESVTDNTLLFLVQICEAVEGAEEFEGMGKESKL